MSMVAHLLRVLPEELEAYRQNSALLKDRIFENTSADPQLYDIDSAWDGIIYLLTGSNATDDNTHPLTRVLFSRQLVDAALDMGYGPAHYLLPDQVKELQQEVSAITREQLREHFDPGAMKAAGVYPDAWDQPGTDDYLIEYFETIQEVFGTAAEKNEAVITFLS